MIKINGRTSLLKLTQEDKKYTRINPKDLFCLEVEHGVIKDLKDDSVITSSEISANKSILVMPKAHLVPTKYHALVDYSEELAEQGAIVSPYTRVVAPKEEGKIGLLIRTTKKLDLTKIDFMFKLYIID